MNLVNISKAIETFLNAEMVGFTGTVTRNYDPRIESPEEKLNDLAQNVFIVPLGVEFRESSDRGNDRNVYRFGIIYCVKFLGQYQAANQAVAFTDFIDAQLVFVEDQIYNRLKDVEYKPVAGAFLESADWRDVYRVDYARSYGIFWSEIDLEYFIDEPNTV